MLQSKREWIKKLRFREKVDIAGNVWQMERCND